MHKEVCTVLAAVNLGRPGTVMGGPVSGSDVVCYERVEWSVYIYTRLEGVAESVSVRLAHLSQVIRLQLNS